MRENGQLIKLTRTERAVLAVLLKYKNQVVPYETILREAWDDYFAKNCSQFLSYPYTYINRLRNKLEIDNRNPRHILTETGVGYILVTEAS